jgi:hypothetical protein
MHISIKDIGVRTVSYTWDEFAPKHQKIHQIQFEIFPFFL